METDKYDPKLSQAGFMDLVVALEAQLETPDSRKILTGMPQAQRVAVCQLHAIVKNYVDVIEGGSSPSALGGKIKQVKEITDEETHAGPFTQGWEPAPTPLHDAEQTIGKLLHECGGLQQQVMQFKTVYREFNNLLCHIGYEGSVDADSRYVWDAMQALKQIDGGVYGEQFASEKVESHESPELNGRILWDLRQENTRLSNELAEAKRKIDSMASGQPIKKTT